MAMGHPFLITMSTKVASKAWKDLISEYPCSVTLAHFLGLLVIDILSLDFLFR